MRDANFNYKYNMQFIKKFFDIRIFKSIKVLCKVYHMKYFNNNNHGQCLVANENCWEKN